MKRLTTLTILLLFLSIGLKAQVWEKMYLARNFYGHRNLALNEIAGSPYLDPEYANAKVTDRNGIQYQDIPLRYNCYSDVLEFKKDGNAYDVNPKDQVRRAEFGGRIFCYLDYASVHSANNGYFQLLTEGKANLYVRYHIAFYEREELKGYAIPKPARFDNLTETYWISIDGAPAREIFKKNDLPDLFSDKKNEIQEYISSQKLSFKKVNDLKKIVSYYNTL